MTPPTETGNPLEVEDEAWDRDIDLMIKSPYLAARAAVRAWREQQPQQQGPGTRKGTFIMTGNLLPRQILPVPALVTLGVGKSGAFSWVGLADLTFKGEGIRFVFIPVVSWGLSLSVTSSLFPLVFLCLCLSSPPWRRCADAAGMIVSGSSLPTSAQRLAGRSGASRMGQVTPRYTFAWWRRRSSRTMSRS